MPIGPARMPLFDHLSELRMRLVRIVACLVVAVSVFLPGFSHHHSISLTTSGGIYATRC